MIMMMLTVMRVMMRLMIRMMMMITSILRMTVLMTMMRLSVLMSDDKSLQVVVDDAPHTPIAAATTAARANLSFWHIS